ncbi:TetR/AcrR family transcriptional regulator [Mycobacterium sp. NPDC003323]
MAVGRPRGFRPEQVLDIATRLFWEHGFDGVSVSDLTDATGVNRRSLYAAFGSKEDLFRRAAEHYVAGYGNYAAAALRMPTARDVARAMVHGAADATIRPGHPAGCLLVQGGCELAEMREAAVTVLAERFAQAQAAGEIPGEDPVELARWIAATCQGIAVQARSGASGEDLHAIADRSLRAWPESS